MQQLTQEKHTTTLRDTLLQLRQSLAGADPFATPTDAPFAAQAQALADAFDNAPDTERQTLLLHAFDEAIAAIELAARLADAMNSTHNGAYDNTAAQQVLDTAGAACQTKQASNHAEDPLFAAYRAFVESQPSYQELYHYRNALAEQQRKYAAGNVEA